MSRSSRFCMSSSCTTGNPFGNDSLRYQLNLIMKKVKKNAALDPHGQEHDDTNRQKRGLGFF